MTENKPPLSERALAFATKAHVGQTRKYDNTPYISHPIEVAAIVARATNDPITIAAAYLHDVVEDCDIGLDRIRDEFGEELASVVWHVTGISTKADGNRAARVAIDRAHYAKGCHRAQTVKVADMISNLGTIVGRDPSFAKIYLPEKQRLLAVLTKADKTLVAEAQGIIARSLTALAPRPLREIRAFFDDTTIRVYQAYRDEIADSALRHGRFVSPPFSLTRMTWIKPSFLWMMYRAGWGYKDEGQKRILAIDISREGFEWALTNSSLSHKPTTALSPPVRIQWDPERDIHHQPLDHRTIQIGLSGIAVEQYVDSWIQRITDVTELSNTIGNAISNGRTLKQKACFR